MQEMLYKQTASKMLAVCMRYAKDRMEAEDVLQMGYVKIFQKVKEYRGEGSFEGWIRRIMVNTAIESYQ
jgi:RNA polymerase sigma factor (sigma-70 family)